MSLGKLSETHEVKVNLREFKRPNEVSLEELRGGPQSD